jgi:septal ring factor EnvC (AmiA/AmiB activator)
VGLRLPLFNSRRIGRLFLLSLLIVAAPSFSETEAEKRARLEALRKSIDSLRTELRSVKTDRDQLLNALEDSEKAIGELSTKAQQLKRKLEKQEQQLNQLRERKRQLEQDKEAQQSHVGEHINAAYRLGQQSNLRLLLNQQDPTLVARNLKYFQYLTQARTAKIDSYLATIEELRQVEVGIAAQTEQLQQSHAQLKEKHESLLSQRKERKSTLRKLQATIASKDGKLQEMQREQERLEQVLAQVALLLEDITLPANAMEFGKMKGRLPWPTTGAIQQRFGSERIAGKMRWQGVVISADAGSPVRAVHHGRVVFSDYLRGHGLLVIVDHGMGFMSLYARNQALYKEIGEWVNAGEVIASVGNSGGQASAGLYFELRHNGRPTDPQQWIKAT